MLRKAVISGMCLGVLGVASLARLHATESDTRVAEAAMQHNRALVQSLLKQGADVNAPQGDGMSAMHWAATNDDLEMVKTLIAAGANMNATTRIGGYTPIFMASKTGDPQLIITMLFAGANAKARTTTGLTPVMVAASAGHADVLKLLIGFDGDVNARESGLGQTALMFAAANNRPDAIRVLMDHGADWKIASKVVDVVAQAAAGRAAGGGGGRAGGGGGGRGAAAAAAGAGTTPPADATGGGRASVPVPVATATASDPQVAAASGRGPRAGGAGAGGQGAAQAGQDQQGGNNGSDTRPPLIDFQGGLTPLLFAARQGNMGAVQSLLDCGVNVNQVSPGDKSSPLLIATINGHFDVAMYLLSHGADPNIASTVSATPLYAALNIQYAPHAFYPQPSPKQEKTSHLELMHALLEHGADPTIKLKNKLWYTGYNFDQSGVDAKGSTPFWRAAQAADIDAMRLLMDYGADPMMPSDAVAGGFRQPGVRPGADGAVPAPPRLAAKVVNGVTPLQMAAGAGFDGNFQVIAPGGFLPALKYLVEELHADISEADYRGMTAVHDAAFRGDNEMLLYLVSKGADVMVETKAGETAIDLANGPVQRIQPFPETIAILEKMGVKNNHRCVSCGG